MSRNVIEVDVECGSCGGTGVYIGFAEKDGSAVVCSTCGGEGHSVRRITTWNGERRTHDGVITVARRNVGIALAPGIDPHEVTYEKFLAGKLPEPSTYEEVLASAQLWKARHGVTQS